MTIMISLKTGNSESSAKKKLFISMGDYSSWRYLTLFGLVKLMDNAITDNVRRLLLPTECGCRGEAKKKLVAICGVSGMDKLSLALNTMCLHTSVSNELYFTPNFYLSCIRQNNIAWHSVVLPPSSNNDVYVQWKHEAFRLMAKLHKLLNWIRVLFYYLFIDTFISKINCPECERASRGTR
jgi:hypothetical protein